MAHTTEHPLVGVFDSGVGGLTVVAALHRLAPGLAVRYLADTAYFPYGERTEREIAARTLELGRALVAEGCDLLVVACNSASSAALEELRAAVEVPVVGMEPPLKPAAERTRSGRVLVLATPATAAGERIQRLQRNHGGSAQIEVLPMPGLADRVELGQVAGPELEAYLEEALEAPLAAGVDEVALGCTHYGFLRSVLGKVLPPGVEVIDAAEPVARRILQQLEAHGHALSSGSPRSVECAATGDGAAFAATLERLRAAGADLPPTVMPTSTARMEAR
jgi:glutamate racemase